MWDLTIPGNNDHDFYITPGDLSTAILVHNCAAWQNYEQKNGSQQTPMTTVVDGQQVSVRLDAPISSDGIIDYKDYNWDSPAYQNSFIQERVISSFQRQIAVYQTLSPNVTFQFSQQPPDWAVNAIQAVGGDYIVKS
jgi:hypothetical protein